MNDSENTLKNKNESFKQIVTVGSISITVFWILYFTMFISKNYSQTYLKTITVLKISYTIVKLIINDKLNEYFPTWCNRRTYQDKKGKNEKKPESKDNIEYSNSINEVKIRKKPRMMSSLPLSSLSGLSDTLSFNQAQVQEQVQEQFQEQLQVQEEVQEQVQEQVQVQNNTSQNVNENKIIPAAEFIQKVLELPELPHSPL
jgi:hypothetical protein